MSEDIAVVMAILVAEGMARPTEEGKPSGFRITAKGYAKAYEKWMAMIGEDRLLLALFFQKVRSQC